jgi:hypothetical protein
MEAATTSGRRRQLRQAAPIFADASKHRSGEDVGEVVRRDVENADKKRRTDQESISLNSSFWPKTFRAHFYP